MKRRSCDLLGCLTVQSSKTCPSDLTHQNRYNEKVVEYSANGMIKRFQRRCLSSRWDRYLGMTAAMTQVPVPTAMTTREWSNGYYDSGTCPHDY